MKKWIVLVVLMLIVSVAFAATQYTVGLSSQDDWVVIDTTTSAGDEPTDLAVDERTYSKVAQAIAAAASGDGEISVYAIPDGVVGARFRCIGITDGQSVTYQIYLGTLANGYNCNLANSGQLAFTIGTQASTTSTYELADTLTVTAKDWLKTWSTASPVNNRVAEGSIDFMGADMIVIVPTTAGCNCKLLMKGLSGG